MPAPKGNKYAVGANSGRRTKMTSNTIQVIKQVIDDNILFCKDEELIDSINELLPKEDQISYITFSKWKAGDSQANNPLFEEFLYLIKKALVKEKKRLLEKLETDKIAWQRWAWILERKFDEWNIRSKGEVNHNVNVAQLPDIIIK